MRVIVSPIPGTTRDAIDVPFEVETDGVRSKYILIDTAGMRKTRRVDDSIEFFSVQRSEESIVRSDITVLVIDAEAGITEQDKKIADVIVENRKACILVINKWDLFDADVREMREEEIERRNEKKRTEGQAKPLTTLAEFAEWVQKKLFFLDYAPVIFTSAKSGFHLDRLLEAVRYVAAQLQQKVPTAILNRTIRDAIEQRQPISDQGPPAEIFLCHAGAPGTADVFAVREPRRIVFRAIQKKSRRRIAQGVRLRRLSDGAGAESATENRGGETKIQARARSIAQEANHPPHQKTACARPAAWQQSRQGPAQIKVVHRCEKAGFFRRKPADSIDFIWEYLPCNFFANFS